MKLGILGGTFDPVHYGHLAAAKCVCEAYALDQVWFMPAGVSPFKIKQKTAAFYQRLQMVALAIEGISAFSVCAWEGWRSGISYTVDTLRQIHQRMPQAELYFILGADAFAGFEKWKEAGTILELCRLVVVNRPDMDESVQGKDGFWQHPGYRERVQFLQVPGIAVSSSELRQRLQQGEPVCFMLPPAVETYIKRHGIYGGEQMVEQNGVDIQEIKGILQARLNPKRYEHSLGVAETAEALARHYQVDPKQAYLAGLVHDFAKGMKKEELLDIAQREQLFLDPIEKELPEVLHATVGAWLLPRETAVQDPAVLQAVSRHTLGALNMSVLDKIIFVADMIEPHRAFADIEKERRIAFQYLDRAVLHTAEYALRYCIDTRKLIHPLSIRVRNQTLQMLEARNKDK